MWTFKQLHLGEPSSSEYGILKMLYEQGTISVAGYALASWLPLFGRYSVLIKFHPQTEECHERKEDPGTDRLFQLQ